jgi:glucan phosphoethanolaminetransferase (alkaline phosphatase superfamily)
MKNYESIKKYLCDKLEDWDIEPIILAKAICVFLILVVLIATFIIFPKLFGILLIMAICIAVIALIYVMIEEIS